MTQPDNVIATDRYHESDFWIVSENLFILPVLQSLMDVQLFLDTTNELVILGVSLITVGRTK